VTASDWGEQTLHGAEALGVAPGMLQLLASLRDRRRVTVGQLMSESGLSRNGVQRYLNLLIGLEVLRVEYGAIEVSFRPGRRYTLLPERLEELAWEVFEQLQGR